jgi:hypothetical protein
MTQYATLRDFVQDRAKRSPDELEHALQRAAKALADSGEEGLVQVRILGEQGPRHFHFKLTPKRCTLHMEEAEKPTLELIGLEETAWSVLDGSLSPLEAFRQGKMRIRGDVALGRRLLRQIASSPNAKFDICEIGV